MKFISLGLLAALSTGCIIDNGGDDAPENDVQPASGAWAYAERTPVSGSCKSLASELEEGGSFQLTNNGNDTITIKANDQQPFNCTLNRGAFNCPERASLHSNGGSATVNAKVSATGTFSSARRGSGRQHADATCTGADCAVIEAMLSIQFPCTFDVDFVIAGL